ncbi:hypothetical protein AVS7_01459 [Acidovorax sp. MR-S7]|nr:hypothetical protein AVS7_01459 [Acidovorax sp. MR-S7]
MVAGHHRAGVRAAVDDAVDTGAGELVKAVHVAQVAGLHLDVPGYPGSDPIQGNDVIAALCEPSGHGSAQKACSTCHDNLLLLHVRPPPQGGA